MATTAANEQATEPEDVLGGLSGFADPQTGFAKQWAAWLRVKWPKGVTPGEFAERIGKGRSTVYAMLAGEYLPPAGVWATIAAACGLPATPWSLVPPKRFVADLLERERRNETKG